MAFKPLRLRADDAEDLSIISAALQDAVFVLGDLSYDAKTRRFVAGVNRFIWEKAPRHGPFERVRSALRVDDVRAVRSRNVRLGAPDAAGVLLRLHFEAGAEPPEGALILTLAGGGEIRLAADCLNVSLTDFGAPWSTPNRPDHEKA